jgi:type IV pilus assembly protein PilM
MFFTKKRQQQRKSVFGLDLGSSQIKAVVASWEGDRSKLLEYAIQKLPATPDKPLTKSQFAGELHQLLGKLKTPDRYPVVTVNCRSAMVTHADVPRMPIEEIRSALQLPPNCVRYLRRELVNYYFDVIKIPEPASDGKAKKQTMKVLVVGASRDEIGWYRDALTEVKLRPEVVELSAVSVVNAFQASYPEVCEKEAVLLLDIGAASTTINLLRQGLPMMTRIMRFGGTQLSENVAQVLMLQPAEAEDEKIKMSEPVRALIKPALLPLAREVRASIDFFERQEECHVTKAFAGGGSATAPDILQYLSEEVGLKLEQWNPLHRLDLSHFGGETAELTLQSPTLGAAVGAAVARLFP